MPAESESAFCPACSHNRLVPDIATEQGIEQWRRISQAQRHLFYSILRLGLPHPNRDADPAGGLVFDFLVDEVAPDGSLLFTDTGNNCIRKIDPAGVISTVAGRCTVTYAPATGDFAGDGGPATEALLNWPYGIELHGNKLYIADSYNHRVRVVNL